MGMRRLVVLFGLALAVLAFTQPARAGLEIIDIGPLNARQLAGVVVDREGQPAAGVAVQECDAIFVSLHAWTGDGKPLPDELEPDCNREPKHVLRSTKTDANGRFAFPHQKMGTTHYLFLHSELFDSVRVTVKLRRFARAEVRIKLVVAT